MEEENFKDSEYLVQIQRKYLAQHPVYCIQSLTIDKFAVCYFYFPVFLPRFSRILDYFEAH